jgi:hypothetical protein
VSATPDAAASSTKGPIHAHVRDLIAAFRFGSPLVAQSRCEITGELLRCVLGAKRGIRFRSHERGESSLEQLDDSVENGA